MSYWGSQLTGLQTVKLKKFLHPKYKNLVLHRAYFITEFIKISNT